MNSRIRGLTHRRNGAKNANAPQDFSYEASHSGLAGPVRRVTGTSPHVDYLKRLRKIFNTRHTTSLDAVRHTSDLRPLVADATKARAVGLRSNCTHNPRLCRALTTWPMTAARHLWGQLSTRRPIAGPARQVMGKRAGYWGNDWENSFGPT